MAKTRILAISSDPILVGFLRRSLGENDCEVVVKQDLGDELRATIDEERPDLMMLDIMMPGLDGIELCLNIRQQCLTPLIMLSTWDAEDGQVRGLNLSVGSRLTEPFGADGLVARMKNARERNLAAA